jgi:hypothetical protein
MQAKSKEEKNITSGESKPFESFKYQSQHQSHSHGVKIMQ